MVARAQAKSMPRLSSLEFLSAEYDDLHRFRVTARQELSKLSTQLSELADRVDTIGATVEELQRHSFQFNVKILGVPETSPRETPYVRQALPVHGSGNCHASRHRHRLPSSSLTESRESTGNTQSLKIITM